MLPTCEITLNAENGFLSNALISFIEIDEISHKCRAHPHYRISNRSINILQYLYRALLFWNNWIGSRAASFSESLRSGIKLIIERDLGFHSLRFT